MKIFSDQNAEEKKTRKRKYSSSSKIFIDRFPRKIVELSLNYRSPASIKVFISFTISLMMARFVVDLTSKEYSKKLTFEIVLKM